MAFNINLPDNLKARLHRELQHTYPNEGGGFLLGTVESAAVRISDVITIKNVFETEEQFHRYAMTPADWMRIEDEADRRGLALVGYYHSHPDHPAIPSEYDRVHALPNFVYIIVSVCAGQAAETRAWRLQDDHSAFDEQPLIIA